MDILVQDAPIAKGALVKAKAGGRVETAGGGDLAIGRKLTQGNGAQGDFIEVADFFRSIPAA